MKFILILFLVLLSISALSQKCTYKAGDSLIIDNTKFDDYDNSIDSIYFLKDNYVVSKTEGKYKRYDYYHLFYGEIDRKILCKTGKLFIKRGKMVRVNKSNNIIIADVPLKNNLPHGTYIDYKHSAYSFINNRSEQEYKKGSYYGKYTSYHSNDLIKETGERDELHDKGKIGEWITFDSLGNVIERINYGKKGSFHIGSELEKVKFIAHPNSNLGFSIIQINEELKDTLFWHYDIAGYMKYVIDSTYCTDHRPGYVEFNRNLYGYDVALSFGYKWDILKMKKTKNKIKLWLRTSKERIKSYPNEEVFSVYREFRGDIKNGNINLMIQEYGKYKSIYKGHIELEITK